jgi:tRNA threonylcarbamoyladenosine modification (KEOPS) complex Cgi121 subunit
MVDNASNYLNLDDCVLAVTNCLANHVKTAIYDNDKKDRKTRLNLSHPKGKNTKYYKLNDAFIRLIGVSNIETSKISDFITMIQKLSFKGVSIQVINARAAYGTDHLLGVLKITLECQKRNLALTTKPEIDLLLRLSLTNQISLALNHAGLNTNQPAIIIIYSIDKKRVYDVESKIMKTVPNIDDTVLKIDRESKVHIFRLLAEKHIRMANLDDNFITRYLIERSALVIK